MNSTVKGIIAILISSIGFSLMAVFFRLSGDLPVFQKSLFRNLIAMIVPIYFVMKYRAPFFGKLENQPLLILRSTLGLIGVLLNIYAIDHMVLSDADMLMKLNPFWTILLCALFLNEKARKYQVIAMVVAILGALFIIKPTFDSDMMPAVIGLLSGIFAAGAYTALRLLGQREKSYTTVFYFSFFSTVALIPFVIFTYEPMTLSQVIILLLSGVFATVGQFGITIAYSFAAAKDISIFVYASVIFSAILGFILFKEVPDLLSYLGYIIIFLAGYYMFKKAQRNPKPKEAINKGES
ncbi:DMT family transporter [Mammaliicoccus sciuri]|uniref:DMT family transporter n=1 Tax=Mammaliicoccus sciuri TaxID=1296 RepID=UPI003F57B5E8